jgi:hypothetical protein
MTVSSKIKTPETVQVLLFIEDEQQCWTLDLNQEHQCLRRGYEYKIVEYQLSVDK